MKKKIIFIQYVKFLDFHYELFEIAYLKNFFKKVVNLLFPFQNHKF